MKPIRNTALSLVAVSLLVAPLAGCGMQNTVGPVADASSAPSNEARIGTGASDLDQVPMVIQDPGTPDDDASFSPDDSGVTFVTGSGADKPKKAHKPKKPKKH